MQRSGIKGLCIARIYKALRHVGPTMHVNQSAWRKRTLQTYMHVSSQLYASARCMPLKFPSSHPIWFVIHVKCEIYNETTTSPTTQTHHADKSVGEEQDGIMHACVSCMRHPRGAPSGTSGVMYLPLSDALRLVGHAVFSTMGIPCGFMKSRHVCLGIAYIVSKRRGNVR